MNFSVIILNSAFRIPDSGFWFPDSGFRIPAFRVAPILQLTVDVRENPWHNLLTNTGFFNILLKSI